jgi:hypothetical protein
MAAATALRVGQDNGSGATDANFLEIYGGEVLTAFEENNVMSGRHMERTITEGKSASFPATWKLAASYHTVGAEITGQTSNASERVILIDQKLIAPVFIPDIDEAMNHFDYRQIYSVEAGRALANTYDANIQIMVGKAARASATVTGGNGGSAITAATSKTDSDVLIGAVYDAVQSMDEKDVPSQDRALLVLPAQYYLMAQNTKVLTKDWNDGNGDYSKGAIHRVADCEIIKTNNLPSTALGTTPTGTANDYGGDFSTTSALVFQKGAAGTLKLMDMKIGSDGFQERWQGSLIVAKYALGHGILRPECAVEIKTA